MALLSTLLSVVIATVISSAIEGVYEYQPKRVPVGTVFFYEKSNIDSTHVSNVAQYVVSTSQLESLKWTSGFHQATLVKAEMDWKTFSVRRFESLRFDDEGNEQTIAMLTANEDGTVLDIEVGAQKMNTVVEHLPWHSYDFDFGSLGFTMPHLKNPRKGFTIGICDVVRSAEGPTFQFKGTVNVEYDGNEKRHGTRCLKYRIDGEGLENRGGLMWVDAKKRHIVDFEIDLPDEPGYETGKMRLIKTAKMKREEWEAFKKTRE